MGSRKSTREKSEHARWYKRPFDLTILVAAHLLLLPIWVVLWTVIPLAILLDTGRPIFYRQRRLTRNGRQFYVLKFRTMVKDAEKMTGAVWATQSDPRVTRVGRLLRSLALDEMPQVINILRGELSFVGPRPERPELYEQFDATVPGFRERLRVSPGLTGLAQVFGKYDSPPRVKLRYDRIYVRRMSLVLDLRLLFLSAWVTLMGRWESREQKFGVRSRKKVRAAGYRAPSPGLEPASESPSELKKHSA